MRKILPLFALAATSAFIVHCSSSDSPAKSNLNPLPTTSASTDSSSKKTKTAPPSTSAPSTAVHPPKAAADGGTKAVGPGANCQALSTCCSKLTNSEKQASCLQTAGKANEQVCTSAEKTFSCDTLTTAPPTRGPSCTGLTSGALYCGNDGPGGDPTTLYLCTGTTISISRVCPNGCTSNAGIDDACAATGTPPPATASCSGLSGDYCGTDFVGGNANTLYSCANDKVASSKVCPNGCLTNPDATLNDTCDAAPATTTVSCDGLPDEAFCGLDLGGDEDTLYTCLGGAVSKTTVCTDGCTVAAPNVSDYCSSTTTPDCAFLDDGDWCGTNGVFGDPDTLYTCSGGEVLSNPTVCTFGCISGDPGGSDMCNGDGH